MSCPNDIIDGSLITMNIRKKIFGNVAGGSGSMKPEEYQRKKIIEGTNIDCKKTNIRINLRTNILIDIIRPNIKNDGYDYSENFDGLQIINNNKIFINLKCIVGKGGSQTRSLREVYWFIEGQLKTLKNLKNIYYANILDGDEAFLNISKYNYLLSLEEYENEKYKIYVGDLKNYFKWFEKIILNE